MFFSIRERQTMLYLFDSSRCLIRSRANPSFALAEPAQQLEQIPEVHPAVTVVVEISQAAGVKV
jgi:hypothetical protein